MTTSLSNISNERHYTTIVGPQADAILDIVSHQGVIKWKNRSVEGLTVLEVWANAEEEEKEEEEAS